MNDNRTESRSETPVEVAGEQLLLLAEKAIFLPKGRELILSDIHLGKSGHFRKHGIPAPGAINSNNLDRLGSLIRDKNPKRLIVLGDLFHSEANREWFEFEEWRAKFDIPLLLVKGNHDLLHPSFYEKADIDVVDEFVTGPFRLVHDRNDISDLGDDEMLISGHIHPSIRIKGRGRQSLRLPCFLIGEKEILLPAFGGFTGTHNIDPGETDRVYAVVEDSVLPIKV
ncbi:MAG: ligase-associated DNA damage response endonuclease PdeM [Balneolaceae bacterium]|nr:ligase-associated DNA damage response endonuclease PdeM [Balneolaceae bacterium]MCH8549978.1 ligase-associated DNA damage response endonuclease PdeM [Balneolaceae bacterium]